MHLLLSRLRAASLFLLVSATPCLAIPSPELVIGSLSSLSQLIALASGLFGGAAVLGLGARHKQGSKLPVRAIAVILAVLCLSAGLNFYQYFDSRAARRAHLEATLVRPSKLPGVPVNDPNLKELSYSEQIKHPLGISTAEGERLLTELQSGKTSNTVFVDVRENAETAMGSFNGAQVLRYADIDIEKFKSQLGVKQAVLICHNGNRSSETCAALAALGIDCRFVVGGLEKWLTEGRQIGGLEGRTLETLRAIPPYRNESVLLDTEEAKLLVESEQAYFLDVRYEGDFAAGHLPNAININVRATPTAALKAKIEALPKRPIVVPCYDRRSCFFGEVIGLELMQAGHDFRGRYTVPWEYFTPSAPPPHVVAFQEQAQRGLWGRAADALAGALERLAGGIGFLPAALAMALVSRLIILPVSLKAERDQLAARNLAPELEALRTSLRHDPVRRSRALRNFYKRHGLTPGRNMLALLFLPVLALSVAAIQTVATRIEPQVPGFGPMTLPDYRLALLFGLLVAAYLHISFGRSPRAISAIWLVGAPAFAVVAGLLSAAVNVYMLFSMLLLLLQNAVVRRPWRDFRVWRQLRAGVVDLELAAEVPGCGGKATRLGELLCHKLPVPNGVVLTGAFLEGLQALGPSGRKAALDSMWRRVGAKRVAVRSSSVAEDGAEHSFAGVFESVLNVERGELETAIMRVLASFNSERALSYGVSGGGANIIIQEMVQAEFSGVLFTRDPSSAGHMLVEMGCGLAESLVSGSVDAITYRFGRHTRHLSGDETPHIGLEPLLELGARAEKAFGRPQDLEWTYVKGAFCLVQSRDITSVMKSIMEDERHRVLELAAEAGVDEAVFIQNELTELLPEPTPASLSLMQDVWAAGGSVDLACRTLGLKYRAEEGGRPYLVALFGRLYVDRREQVRRGPLIGWMAARRMRGSANDLSRAYRMDFVPNFVTRMALLEATSFDALPTEALLKTLASVRRSFIEDTYAKVDVVNIAASFYVADARRALEGVVPDVNGLLSHGSKTDLARDTVLALRAPHVERPTLLTKALGHRSDFDYELAWPRYAETPERLTPMATVFASGSSGPRTASPTGLPRAARQALSRARRFQVLKENAKNQAARELSVLRQLLLALGNRFELGNLIFQLTLDEVLELPRADLHETAIQRRAAAKLFAVLDDLPREISPATIEAIGAARAPTTVRAMLAGSRVSGSAPVEGRARIVTKANIETAMLEIEHGDILVTRMVSPAWLPYFSKLGGVVCEVGGWLSHTAILARENDLAMTVGVRDATAIPDGARVRLELDGSVRVLDQHLHPSSVASNENKKRVA